jgi:hypothetical protein
MATCRLDEMELLQKYFYELQEFLPSAITCFFVIKRVSPFLYSLKVLLLHNISYNKSTLRRICNAHSL